MRIRNLLPVIEGLLAIDNHQFDFESVLELLMRKGVKFLVVGGVACALNGFIRATEDLDILVEPSEANLNNLIHTLTGWGKGYASELSIEDFPVSPGAVRVIEAFPLDIFTLLADKNYNDFLPSARKNDQGILYLDPQSLIETKRHTHREKDSLDILALKNILKEGRNKKK